MNVFSELKKSLGNDVMLYIEPDSFQLVLYRFYWHFIVKEQKTFAVNFMWVHAQIDAFHDWRLWNAKPVGGPPDEAVKKIC